MFRLFDNLENILWIFFIVMDTYSLVSLSIYANKTSDQLRIILAGSLLSALLLVKILRLSAVNKADKERTAKINELLKESRL